MASPDLPGLGIDLVEIDRFRASLARGGEAFRRRIFHPSEQAACESRPDPAPHYAARFAAKEAAMKCLGHGYGQEGVAFLDFEVLVDPGGAPRIRLHGRAAVIARDHGIRTLRLSLTHTATTAGAVVAVQDRG